MSTSGHKHWVAWRLKMFALRFLTTHHLEKIESSSMSQLNTFTSSLWGLKKLFHLDIRDKLTNGDVYVYPPHVYDHEAANFVILCLWFSNWLPPLFVMRGWFTHVTLFGEKMAAKTIVNVWQFVMCKSQISWSYFIQFNCLLTADGQAQMATLEEPKWKKRRSATIFIRDNFRLSPTSLFNSFSIDTYFFICCRSGFFALW